LQQQAARIELAGISAIGPFATLHPRSAAPVSIFRPCSRSRKGDEQWPLRRLPDCDDRPDEILARPFPPWHSFARRRDTGAEEAAMISVLIGVLIICVVGAICFWVIEKFVNDRRLANLLKLLVVLICLAAILQRVLPLVGIGI
jgi:hypothetical protein